MANNVLSNLHYSYMDKIRHWHSESERYTGGDALYTAIENGWAIGEVVGFEEFEGTGMKAVAVYYFELSRGSEHLTMPVLNNPFVRRLIKESGVKPVPMPKVVKTDQRTA
jgi:hypothetical protein